MEPLRVVPLLADQPRADDLTVGCLFQTAIGLIGHQHLTDPGDGEGIGEAAQHERHQGGAHRAADIAEHVAFLSNQRRNQQIDQLDADERRDQAADAVDPQVAGERFSAVSTRKRTPRSANGMSAE